jgi:hypothetical protein
VTSPCSAEFATHRAEDANVAATTALLLLCRFLLLALLILAYIARGSLALLFVVMVRDRNPLAGRRRASEYLRARPLLLSRKSRRAVVTFRSFVAVTGIAVGVRHLDF